MFAFAFGLTSHTQRSLLPLNFNSYTSTTKEHRVDRYADPRATGVLLLALWLTVALRSGALPSCTEILRRSYLSMAIWVLGSGAPVQEALASPERAAAHTAARRQAELNSPGDAG